jgi:hypothetical protein
MTRALLLTVALALCCLGAATGAFLAGRSNGPNLSVLARAATSAGAHAGARRGAAAGRRAGYRAGYNAGYAHAYPKAYRAAYRHALSR